MDITKYLNNIPNISVIKQLSRQRRGAVYLVGGFLRDIYLKKYGKYTFSPKSEIDIDFSIEKDVAEFVKAFAQKISAKYIVLDEQTESFRVIIKGGAEVYTYDFTRMQAGGVQEDLSLRDFSINSLAVNISERGKYKVIDYFRGKEDIKKGRIRVVREEVIINDPLRILRGFSSMALWKFRIEPGTEHLMVTHKQLLKNVSEERINQELFKIFSSEHSYETIQLMSDLRILDEVIPYVDACRGVLQGDYHHLDVWRHSLETLRQFERMWRNIFRKRDYIAAYLQEELAQDRRRILILKLACLLHDIGKPVAKKEKNKQTIFYAHEKIGRDLAREVSFHLRLSFREQDFLTKLIFWHLRPGYLADQVTPSQRAVYRFFRDTQEEGVGVILLSLSDWRATRGVLIDQKKRRRHERIMLELIDHYFKKQKDKPIPALVNGYDIMRRFNLSPSPLIGDILQRVKEEQALGNVTSLREAYKIAQAVIEKSKKYRQKNSAKVLIEPKEG